MSRLLLNVTSNFPYPRSPFSGIFLARQMSYLQKVGWESVTVHPQAALSRQRLGSPGFEKKEFGEVHRPAYFWGGWKLPEVLPFDESWAFERSVRRCVQRSILPRQKPDLVVCNWLYPGGPGCVRLARELGIPALIVARGGDVRLLAAMYRPRRQQLVDVLVQADSIVTNGRSLREELQKVAPELSARAVVLDFGVDSELFSPHAGGAHREPPAAGPRSWRENDSLRWPLGAIEGFARCSRRALESLARAYRLGFRVRWSSCGS